MLAILLVAAGALLGDGGWERTVAPANGLSDLEAVRVGDRVVVVGGADYDQTDVKAVVLDLDSGRWARAARSGLPWRAGHSVVRAGREVIVWGGTPSSTAAAYAVARDAWRRIPRGPLGGRSRHTAVWTGTEMIVWGGWTANGVRRNGAAYDPARRRWRRIERAPLAGRLDHAAVWTGSEMVVWGGSRPASGGRSTVLSDGAAYDPARDRWRPLAPAPVRSAPATELGVGVEVDVDAAWTGHGMFVWNGVAGALYAPTLDQWSRFPDLGRWNPGDTAAWTGEELIVWGGTSGAAYDPALRRWRTLPQAPLAGRDRHAAVWTGDAMLVWGGCCRGSRHHRDGAFYRPG
jgi:hypothetical protein